MFQKYEHLTFPSQRGQNTNIYYLARITIRKRLTYFDVYLSPLQSVWSISVQLSHTYKDRLNTQFGVGPSYLRTNHFSYPPVLIQGPVTSLQLNLI